MIFDTNILIYLSNYSLSPDRLFLHQANISVITRIEALGFAFKNPAEQTLMRDLCDALTVVPLTEEIAELTIILRIGRKIKLPDAVIYATAMATKMPLLTNNISDFKSLPYQVELIDPFNS